MWAKAGKLLSIFDSIQSWMWWVTMTPSLFTSFLAFTGGWSALVIALVFILTITCASIVVFILVQTFPLFPKNLKSIILRYPIIWDYSYFLSATKRNNNPIYISRFGLVGETRKEVFVEDAFLKSLKTGEKIDILIKTDSGFKSASELNSVPKGAKICVQGLFRDNNATQYEGIDDELFMKNWGSFEFNFKCNGKTHRKTFSDEDTATLINKLNTTKENTPRVTAKNNG